MIAPCKECPRKGCGKYHDQCRKYLEFQKYQKEEYERRKISVLNSYNSKKEVHW